MGATRRARFPSRDSPTSTPPIAAIASTPRSGREPCAATPAVSTSSHTNPLWATHTSRSVGSVTIAASARDLAGHALGADRLVLLVAHERDDHVAAQPGICDRGRRGHDRRHAALHVERAATVHAVAVDPRDRTAPACPRRRRCPCARRGAASGRRPSLGRWRSALARPGATSSTRAREAAALEPARRERRDLGLAGAAGHERRVDRFDLDEPREELGRLAHATARSSAIAGSPGSGATVRMEDVRELGDAVRQARGGPRVVGVGLDGDRPAGEADSRRLGRGPLGAEAARRHDDDLGAGRGNVVPRDRERRAAGASQHLAAAGERHHLGHPVPRSERWVEPLRHEHRHGRRGLRRPRPPRRSSAASGRRRLGRHRTRRAALRAGSRSPRRRRPCAGRARSPRRRGCRILPTSSPETAQTWHRSCVITTSGRSSRISSSSTA